MKSTYPWLISLFACLFVTLQTGAIAHATCYADSPHEHNGMVCDIGTVVADTQALLPAAINPEPFVTARVDVFTSAFLSAPRLTPPGRAPPGRSPPTLF